MRCYICNKVNAEHYDIRDNTFICEQCKDEVDEVLYEWNEEEELDEDSPDMP